MNQNTAFSYVRDFHNNVAVGDNPELLAKKQDAEIALQHLEMLANMGNDGQKNPDCPPEYQLST